MNENLSLGRIAGIHVGLNWSLLVVAALIAWSLATGILPSAAPGQASGAYWTAGIVSAFVFLASLLAHELAHSVAVRRRLTVQHRHQLAWCDSPDHLCGPAHKPPAGRRVLSRCSRGWRW